jgi:hypothetical protein
MANQVGPRTLQHARMVGGAASSAAGRIATGVQADGREFDSNEYFVDTLFRSDSVKPDSNGAPVLGEVGRIFYEISAPGDLPAADKSYLAIDPLAIRILIPGRG